MSVRKQGEYEARKIKCQSLHTMPYNGKSFAKIKLKLKVENESFICYTWSTVHAMYELGPSTVGTLPPSRIRMTIH